MGTDSVKVLRRIAVAVSMAVLTTQQAARAETEVVSAVGEVLRAQGYQQQTDLLRSLPSAPTSRSGDQKYMFVDRDSLRALSVYERLAATPADAEPTTRTGGRSPFAQVQDSAPRSVATGKLGVEDLVNLAINTHPSISSKKADLAGAKADVKAALWQYFPTPSVGIKRDDQGRDAVVVAVQQPIWSGGRIDAGYDAAKARASSAEVSILEARQNLALSVSNAYQLWMQFAGRSEALTRSLRFHEDQAKSIRRRVDGGVTAEVDLQLVYSRLAQVQADLAAAQSSVRVSMARLAQFVGKPLTGNDVAKVSADSVKDALIPPTLEGMTALAAVVYPALRRLESDIEAAKQDVRIKRSAMSPTFAIRAEHELNDAYVATRGSRTDNRVLLTLDFTPGAGLTAAAATDAAQARVASLVESREATYREMIDRVSTDYEDFQSAKKRRVDLIRTRKAAIDILASYSRQFEAGKRGWLDVMNAARELTQVDTSIADVDAQLIVTAYKLKVYAGEPEWYSGPKVDAGK